jgi:hypothetical protein
MARERAELRIICYDNVVLPTANHTFDIAVKLVLWFGGDENNISHMLAWSNQQGIPSPIHGIWDYSFRPEETPLINQDHAWIFNPDGILANMAQYDQMFLTDRYKDATQSQRRAFLTTARGPAQEQEQRTLGILGQSSDTRCQMDLGDQTDLTPLVLILLRAFHRILFMLNEEVGTAEIIDAFVV